MKNTIAPLHITDDDDALPTYSVEQVANLLRSTARHIHNLIADCRIDVLNPRDKRKDWKISREALEEFIKSTLRGFD